MNTQLSQNHILHISSFPIEFELPSMSYINFSYVLRSITWYILFFNLPRIYSCVNGYPVVWSCLLNNHGFSTGLKCPIYICFIHISILAPTLPHFNFCSSIIFLYMVDMSSPPFFYSSFSEFNWISSHIYSFR